MLQLGTYSRQIQKQYCIQAMRNLLSAVAIKVELLPQVTLLKHRG